MNRLIRTLVAGSIAACLPTGSADALQKPPATAAAKSQRINACSLLTREEVKKIMPWPAVVDQFPTQEEAIGTDGSSCEYPSVGIQVLAFRQSMLDSAQKIGKLEPVPGVGDQAFIHHRMTTLFAEMYVKVGDRLLTIQASVPTGKTIDDVKPAVITLAKALVAKLR